MLFPIAIASGLTDRLSAMGSSLETAIAACASNTGASGDLYQRVTKSNDFRIEADFSAPAVALEASLTLASLVGANTSFRAMCAAFDTHCQMAGSVNLDTYLTNRGLQVPETFNSLFQAAKGSPLLAKNVFLQRDILMGSITAGSWSFTSGTALGSGTSGARFSSATPESGQQYLIAALPSGVTTAGTMITVSGLNDSNAVVTTAIIFPTGIANAHRASSVKMRRITNIALYTSDLGSGVITIRNKRERVFSLNGATAVVLPSPLPTPLLPSPTLPSPTPAPSPTPSPTVPSPTVPSPTPSPTPAPSPTP